MNELFLKYLSVSVSVGLVIVAVGLISPIINKRYGARWKKYIWLFLAVLLLIPFGGFLADKNINEAPGASSQVGIVQDNALAQDEREPAAQFRFLMVELPGQVERPINYEQYERGETKVEISALDVLTAVWILGAVIFFGVHLLSYLHFRHRIKRFGRRLKSGSAFLIANEIKKQLNIKSRISIVKYGNNISPMMIGFFRPIILLPNAEFTDEELYYIILHEFIHFKHRDIWVKLLLTASVAVHWFNPCVYYMRYQASKDMELFCDDGVVSMSEKRPYAEAILSTMSAGRGGRVAFSTHFSGTKKVMKQRLENIMNRINKKNGIIILTAVMLIAIVLGSMVGCTVNKSEKDDSSPDSSDAEHIGNVEMSELIKKYLQYEKYCEYDILRFDSNNPADGVEIDGEYYFPVTEPGFTTWAEWESFISSIFTEDTAKEILENSVYKNVDGNVYTPDIGGKGWTLSSDYLFLVNENANDEISIQRNDLREDEENLYRIDVFKLENTASGWRIKEHTSSYETSPVEWNVVPNSSAENTQLANEVINRIFDDYITTIQILTFDMTEEVWVVNGVDQYGNILIRDGIEYAPMKAPYDNIDEVMNTMRKVYSDRMCNNISRYISTSSDYTEYNGRLYCIMADTPYSGFNLPFTEAERNGDTLTAHTTISYDDGDYPFSMVFVLENGLWKIDRMFEDGREVILAPTGSADNTDSNDNNDVSIPYEISLGYLNRKYIDDVYDTYLASLIVGNEAIDEWVNNVYLKKTPKEQEDTSPLYQIIHDLSISREDLTRVSKEHNNRLSELVITALYVDDLEEMKRLLVSPMALYYDCEIYTYDELSKDKKAGEKIPPETIGDYLDFIELVCEYNGEIKYMQEEINDVRRMYNVPEENRIVASEAYTIDSHYIKMTALTFIEAYFKGDTDTIQTQCLADPTKYLSENGNKIETYSGSQNITNRKIKGLADIGISEIGDTAEISLEFNDSSLGETKQYLTMSFVKKYTDSWLIEWYALEG